MDLTYPDNSDGDELNLDEEDTDDEGTGEDFNNWCVTFLTTV